MCIELNRTYGTIQYNIDNSSILSCIEWQKLKSQS